MTYETALSVVSRYLLAALMVGAGVLHFTHCQTFASMVPAYLPWPVPVVLVSGLIELALGVALLPQRGLILRGGHATSLPVPDLT